MMRASQTLLTEDQMKELQLTSDGIPIRRDSRPSTRCSALQELLLPENNNADRYFIPSPICSSTDAFRFQISINLTLKFMPPPLVREPRVTAWSHSCG